MKLQKWITLGILFAPTLSFAQTATKPEIPISSEIKTTVDYLGSIINTMGEGSQDSRFDVDTEYSVQGRELQKRLREKLTQFRASLLTLSKGDFGSNIKLYRDEVSDNDSSHESTAERLNGIYNTLSAQSLNISTSYQAEIKRLIAIETSWIPLKIELSSERKFRKNKTGAFQIIFANGEKQDLSFDFDADDQFVFEKSNSGNYLGYEEETARVIKGFSTYPKIHFETDGDSIVADNQPATHFDEILHTAIAKAIGVQIKTTIYNACKNSSTCKSNLFADYTNYLQQVKNIVNINLRPKLDETHTLTVWALPLGEGNPPTIPYDDLFSAIQTFNFDSDLSQ